MKKVNVAIVGATGLVGQTILQVLAERGFPVGELYLFASTRSVGKHQLFNGQMYEVKALDEQSFHHPIDITLFSAGSEISKQYAPIAIDNGSFVVDNSSEWRMHKEIPLIVPEVNSHELKAENMLIANPNCSTIQCVVPLHVLHQHFKIKRIVYSTYQAVSGSGLLGITDLEQGLRGKEHQFYPHQIANNCLPHIDQFMNNGYTKEEMKMIEETRKILDDPSIQITATTVRVPVTYGHSVSVNVEFTKAYELSNVVELLHQTQGIVVIDNPSEAQYPLASSVQGKDEVYVGRIRRDYSVENGLNLWVVADNIRKGAATNTVQIAELYVNQLLKRGELYE
ncbi:MAG: aspartate-semialdehyde dehydrogenase [Culicoidibacterales bacterium]